MERVNERENEGMHEGMLDSVNKTGLSQEESDQIIRSNKKFKRKITNWIFDNNPATDANMVEASTQEAPPGPLPGTDPRLRNAPPPSFKDMLNHRNYSNHVNPLHSFPEEEDEASDDDCAPEEYRDNPLCPAILLSKEEKIQMRRPWKSALILKMFNGKLGYMALMRRLKKKWSLKGDMTLTDIGCKFYIARFTNQDDYHHVLTQGPWMIEDNYLTIRKWVPNFIPEEAPLKVLTAWVRIPNLSVEYFDGNFLQKIGSKIGKVLRIDKTTSNAERGQFTRLSVEIDLTKPLLSKFWLKGRIWKVQYEGLQLICFNCGCWGHSAQECPPRVDAETNMVHDAPPHTNQVNEDQSKVRPELEHNFGDWMMVRKPIRKRPPRIDVQGGAGDRPVVAEPPPGPPQVNSVGKTIQNLNRPPPRAQNDLTSAIQGEGSRFSVLEGINNDLPILEDVVEEVFEKPSYATVNLGESSQAQNFIKEPFSLAFKLGKDKSPKPKKIEAALKPVIPPAKQSSKSNQLRKQILRVKDSNVTIQARTRVTSKPALGKENTIPLISATSRETLASRNHAESNTMPPPTVNLPPVHAPPSCNISPTTPRENFVRRQADGESVLSGGKPPDPQGGICVPVMGGTGRDAGTDSHGVDPQ